MKIATILGTRPEIIRLSRVIPRLDAAGEHVLVDTGQNYDPALSEVFYAGLGVRRPDHVLGVRADTFGEQVGQIMMRCEAVLRQERPDRLLVLGDTNSTLSAFIAKRLGIRVYHMEAGNRCHDDRVPEEVNRRVVDHSSDVLMPYTERSRSNLLREGIAGERVFVTGNPIFEVLRHHEDEIAASGVLGRLGLEAGRFFLATLHRAENVDPPARLSAFVEAFRRLADRHRLPVIVSTHPRTAARLQASGIAGDEGIRFLPPFGLFDFVHLERNARCVLSDSGTVQEECAILRVPNVTLRDVTERPETLECGSAILTGADPERIVAAVDLVLRDPPGWTPPAEYLVPDVSATVARIVTGHSHGH